MIRLKNYLITLFLYFNIFLIFRINLIFKKIYFNNILKKFYFIKTIKNLQLVFDTSGKYTNINLNMR